jgi:membrane-bound metal-dependent hydrolase YbcI (DUF457 family)
VASYQGHLTVSCLLGAAAGSVAVWQLGLDWGPVFLGAGLTALGGLLPDLDSDSGVPVRELFGLAAAAVPMLLFRRLEHLGFTLEQTLALLGGVYLLIRYGASYIFKRWTVHRGMFHSIPAMFIAGLVVFLLDHNPSNLTARLYLAVGTMIGFLSHLVLDELYSIDFMGVTVRLNKYAGSALKFTSPSWTATVATYVVLLLLAGLAWVEVAGPSQREPTHRSTGHAAQLGP